MIILIPCTCPKCGHRFEVEHSTGPETPLTRARAEKGLSLAQVAEAVGISIRHVGRIERNQANPKLSEAMKMAKLYGKPLDELWPETPDDGESTGESTSLAGVADPAIDDDEGLTLPGEYEDPTEP